MQNSLRLRLKFIHSTALSSLLNGNSLHRLNGNSLHRLNGNSLHRLNGFSLPEISRHTHTQLIISALYMTDCGLHCRQALLPRDRKTTPESAIFRVLHLTCASVTHAE